MYRLPFFAFPLFLSYGLSSCYDWAYYQQNQQMNQTQPSPDSTVIQDTVYLNDGSIIHGKIIEEIPDTSLKIQTASGNVFTYQMSDVQKITHTRVPADGS